MSFFDNYVHDPNNVKKELALLPVGKYNLTIEKVAIKKFPATADKGEGQQLNVCFVVADGEHKGRKVFRDIQLVGSQKKVDYDTRILNTLVSLTNTLGSKLPDSMVGKTITNVLVKHRPRFSKPDIIDVFPEIEMPLTTDAAAPSNSFF